MRFAVWAWALRVLRRGHLRDFEWLLIGAVAILAVVLGYLGLSDVHGPEHDSAGDRIYGALRLFLLDGGEVEEADTTWELQVARFLAPAVAGLATIRAILALFRERLQLIRLRFFARDHVVIAGLGTKGAMLAASIRGEGRRVAVVEQDPRNDAIPGCRERGIAVVTGDATDHLLLEKARIRRASHLVAACGDDGTNVNVVYAARRSAGRNGHRQLEVLVHIDDSELRQVLQARAVELGTRTSVQLETFSLFEDAAAVILDQYPPATEPLDDHASPHVLVAGVEALGEALTLRAAQLWEERGEGRGNLRVTLIGDDASQRLGRLLAQAPMLSTACRIRTDDTAVTSAEFLSGAALRKAGEWGPPTTAYVTAMPETASVAASLALHRHLENHAVRVVAAVQDERSGMFRTLESDMAGLQGIWPVGILNRTLSPELLHRRSREILARAKHEQYLRDELEKGKQLGDQSSLVPWDELPDDLKHANRAFANGVGAAIEEVGCTLVPNPLGARSDLFSFPRGQLEELARREHERWCEDRQARGWRYGPERDDAQKLHPSLVPWDELSEADKERDREAIREIPRMVARAGFEMRPRR